MADHARRHLEDEVARVAAGFPTSLAADVRAVMDIIPEAAHPVHVYEAVTAWVSGDSVTIPNRVYFPLPSQKDVASLDRIQTCVLNAIYSRHHDGYVREAHVASLCRCEEPWAMPYIALLLSEYVIEIAEAIEQSGGPDLALMRAFSADNPDLCRLISKRMVTYWSMYYRRSSPVFREYLFYRLGQEYGLWAERVAHRLVAR